VQLRLLLVLRSLHHKAQLKQTGSNSPPLLAISKMKCAAARSTRPARSAQTRSVSAVLKHFSLPMRGRKAGTHDSNSSSTTEDTKQPDIAEEEDRKDRKARSKLKMKVKVVRAIDAVRHMMPILREPLKQAFGHTQLVALTPSVVTLEWPTALSSFADGIIVWVAFDFELPSMECVYPVSIADRTALSLGSALVLLSAAPLVYSVVSRPRVCAHLGLQAETLDDFFERCATWYVTTFLLVYAPVSSFGVRYFSCRWFGDGYYNRYDPGLKCRDASGVMTEAFQRGMPAALLTIIVVSVGLPGLHFGMLARYWHQKRLDTRKCRRAWGLLYDPYTNDAWYWGSVEVAKTFFSSSLLGLMDGEPVYQCSLGLLTCLLVLVLQSSVRPFRKALDGRISLTTHVGLFSMYLVGLQLQAGYIAPIVLMLGLILLPLWMFAGATLLYLPMEKLALLLTKKAPGLAQRLANLPHDLHRRIKWSLLAAEDFVIGSVSRRASIEM